MGPWPCGSVPAGRGSRSSSGEGFDSSQGVEATHGALGEALDGPRTLEGPVKPVLVVWTPDVESELLGCEL